MWNKKDNMILQLKPTTIQLVAVPESAYDFQHTNNGNCIWFKLPGIDSVTPIDCDLWQKETKIVGTITKTGILELIDKTHNETDILELITNNNISNNVLGNQKWLLIDIVGVIQQKSMKSMKSMTYRLMIYFAHSTLVMYAKTIIDHKDMTVAEFRKQNEKVIKRVFDEGLSIMEYELSYSQLDTACSVYLSSKYKPQSVDETEIYKKHLGN